MFDVALALFQRTDCLVFFVVKHVAGQEWRREKQEQDTHSFDSKNRERLKTKSTQTVLPEKVLSVTWLVTNSCWGQRKRERGIETRRRTCRWVRSRWRKEQNEPSVESFQTKILRERTSCKEHAAEGIWQVSSILSLSPFPLEVWCEGNYIHKLHIIIKCLKIHPCHSCDFCITKSCLFCLPVTVMHALPYSRVSVRRRVGRRGTGTAFLSASFLFLCLEFPSNHIDIVSVFFFSFCSSWSAEYFVFYSSLTPCRLLDVVFLLPLSLIDLPVFPSSEYSSLSFHPSLARVVFVVMDQAAREERKFNEMIRDAIPIGMG